MRDQRHASVLHKCDNRSCVRPAHLFLGSHADNMIDMHKKGRHNAIMPKGEQHPAAKLTAQQIDRIRAIYADGQRSQSSLAAAFNVSQTQISRIVRRKRWA